MTSKFPNLPLNITVVSLLQQFTAMVTLRSRYVYARLLRSRYKNERITTKYILKKSSFLFLNLVLKSSKEFLHKLKGFHASAATKIILREFLDNLNGRCEKIQILELSRVTQMTASQCYDWLQNEKVKRRRAKKSL
jgi:hypothetical protein